MSDPTPESLAQAREHNHENKHDFCWADVPSPKTSYCIPCLHLARLLDKVKQERDDYYETAFKVAVLTWTTGIGRNLRKLEEAVNNIAAAPPSKGGQDG